MLWESGASKMGIFALRIGDVKPNKYGIIATVNGKTGKRDILLIDAVPDVQLYLNQRKGSLDEYLFTVVTGRKPSSR
jgi:hypothetical protein